MVRVPSVARAPALRCLSCHLRRCSSPTLSVLANNSSTKTAKSRLLAPICVDRCLKSLLSTTVAGCNDVHDWHNLTLRRALSLLWSQPRSSSAGVGTNQALHDMLTSQAVIDSRSEISFLRRNSRS